MRRHPIKPRKYLRDGQERWRVHVPLDLVSDENPTDRHFSLEKDALDFARQLTEARKSLYGQFLKLGQSQQAEIMRLWESRKASQSLSVAKVCQDCLIAKRVSGLRPNSLIALKCALDSITATFGAKSISSVQTSDIEAWLASKAAWSPKTKLNNLKYASALFAWAIRKQIVEKNPCLGVDRPKVPFKGVSILPIEGVKKLLWTCQKNDPALLGFVCPVLFGGLRVAESARCKPENIANGIIDLGGSQTKLNVRRAVKISGQLAAWMAVPGVQIGCQNPHERLKAVATVAGVVLTKNCLRHSFCSYTYPLLGAAATARAANNSETMLAKHYLGLVTDEQAKEFAGIMPRF